MLYLALLPPVILGGLFDLKKGIIPNYLTFPLILGGLIFNAIAGNFVTSLIGFFVGFAIGFIAWTLKGMGGGDLKLIAALGAWMGLYPLTVVMLFSSLVGLLWFVLRSIHQKKFFNRVYDFLFGLYLFKVVGIKNLFKFEKDNTVPFGTCIAIGYIIALIQFIYL